ncbi:MAG: phosphodiester glycosidase family protein [Patescibacteria group bacterium]|jgi:exopolysaccharide biosynthesis protein
MRRFSSLFLLLLLLTTLAGHPTTLLAAPAQGSLIKLACPAGAAPDHSCKAVYFYGHDNRRHAFPNEKIYFTWYTGFSTVQTVSSSFLASIPLGGNVTYRPGSKMVKFQTLNNVYAVGLDGTLRWVKTESVATSLYGADWNKKIDDLSDAFFSDYRYGADIDTASDYDKSAELAAATTIDNNLISTSRSERIVTSRGAFDAEIVTLHKNRFEMITDTGNTTDCTNNCTVKSLGEYVAENAATIGIHGTYFCPPEYADCAGKTNTFLWPVYNSAAGVMINASSLPVHEGPMYATTKDGQSFFYHRTKDLQNIANVAAAISNYPSLIENGQIVVESEARLAETNPTTKSIRGGIGFNDRFIYLVIVHSGTVTDLAYVMRTLGATNALNLDGGGSAALWYEGAYIVGPGRALPNAVLFKQK